MGLILTLSRRLLSRHLVSASCAGLTRASIVFEDFFGGWNCRVKPGNDANSSGYASL